jgi:hypothetical protein
MFIVDEWLRDIYLEKYGIGCVSVSWTHPITLSIAHATSAQFDPVNGVGPLLHIIYKCTNYLCYKTTLPPQKHYQKSPMTTPRYFTDKDA